MSVLSLDCSRGFDRTHHLNVANYRAVSAHVYQRKSAYVNDYIIHTLQNDRLTKDKHRAIFKASCYIEYRNEGVTALTHSDIM